MAWLELEPSGHFHVAFRLGKRKFKRSLRTKSPAQAEARRIRLEENIRLVESGRLTIPAGVDVSAYLLSDGRLDQPLLAADTVKLGGLFEEFHENLPAGSMESNSLYTVNIHMNHLRRILRPGFLVKNLTPHDLQRYIAKRSADKGIRGRRLSPTTIKKELTTFSSVWTWARLRGYVDGPFPNIGLRFPKTAEKPPFQTRKTIESQIARGGLTDQEQKELWGCLFLTVDETNELLNHVATSNQPPFLHPMCCMAAFTGARRSEILRSQSTDFDFENHTDLIREKKRSRGKRTSRIVPLAPPLRYVMSSWLNNHAIARFTFSHQCQESTSVPITVDESNYYLRRAVHGSCWEKIRGWHLFRHGLISNCAARGVDQRIIDAWSGHQTDEMRRRYTHLFPNTQQDAIRSVFGYRQTESCGTCSPSGPPQRN